MRFLKNISNQLNDNEILESCSKFDLKDFVDQNTVNYWNTLRPNADKVVEADIFKMNMNSISAISDSINTPLSQLFLVNVNSGIVFPYHKNNYINSQKINKFYFFQISNCGWGHAAWINNHSLFNKSNGDVFVFDSDIIELGAGNSGWEPLKFLIGW